ncbi:MAG TPA: class I SAM-dependent methyltransferase [Aquifex aeolicus]|nr:class I SAM-dependent methyltransferase [Aquifex aeolicus]
MKNTLSFQFSRAVETYEEWALPQRESARLLVEFINPRGKVLDLGCGTGFVSEYLENCEVLGLDISPKMVEVYKERHGIAVLGNAENLPFKDKSFDYVVSNFSLHWTDWKKSISEAIRVAKVCVGIAMPVKGSVSFSSFPFPDEEDILNTFFPKEYKILNMEIPFEGLDLIKFFHYTGTANYKGKNKLKTRVELLKLAKSIKGEYFRMLFLKITLT